MWGSQNKISRCQKLSMKLKGQFWTIPVSHFYCDLRM